ncbi:hypothetical protein MMC16_005062 [Acarospora aff. strigata]|nr:hypothetical protein [Acarospora aff. strigata]
MTEVVVVERRKYHWPEAQLNFWLIIFLAAAANVLGYFAFFVTVQNQMEVGIPWLFSYAVTVSALAIIFFILILILISQRQLLPGIVIIGSFILFVLWLTALIETSIQLFGPSGSVNGNCQVYVQGQQFKGQSLNTLAWLEQNTICNCWKSAFAWELIGTVFLLWMIVMAYQVNNDNYD